MYPFYDNVEDPIDGFKTAKDTDYLLLPMGKYNYNLFDYGKNVGHDMILIDHEKTRKAIDKFNKKWVVIYKKHPAVFKLYAKKNLIMIDKHGNITNNKDRCMEIIINNFVSV